MVRSDGMAPILLVSMRSTEGSQTMSEVTPMAPLDRSRIDEYHCHNCGRVCSAELTKITLPPEVENMSDCKAIVCAGCGDIGWVGINPLDEYRRSRKKHTHSDPWDLFQLFYSISPFHNKGEPR